MPSGSNKVSHPAQIWTALRKTGMLRLWWSRGHHDVTICSITQKLGQVRLRLGTWISKRPFNIILKDKTHNVWDLYSQPQHVKIRQTNKTQIVVWLAQARRASIVFHPAVRRSICITNEQEHRTAYLWTRPSFSKWQHCCIVIVGCFRELRSFWIHMNLLILVKDVLNASKCLPLSSVTRSE